MVPSEYSTGNAFGGGQECVAPDVRRGRSGGEALFVDVCEIEVQHRGVGQVDVQIRAEVELVVVDGRVVVIQIARVAENGGFVVEASRHIVAGYLSASRYRQVYSLVEGHILVEGIYPVHIRIQVRVTPVCVHCYVGI